MSEVVNVKLIQEHLMVGRYLRVRAGKHESPGEWTGLYLYEGKIYTLPITADKFNACRDKVRNTYRHKSTIDIRLEVNVIQPHVLANWDIYGADDGWRVEFKYDVATDKVTYNQPGKSRHASEADSVMVIERVPEEGKPIVERPLDPALSAADDDFPLTMGARHHNIKTAQEAITQLISEGNLAQAVIKNAVIVDTTDPLAAEAEKFPAYWKPLPPNWRAIDTYRVDVLFPLNDSRLTHARKKLLVCGTRTGGKSIRKDIAEAYATLGQWLIENPEV